MNPICLYFDKDSLTDAITTSLFWNLLSEKICFQIQLEESLKLYIGDSKTQNRNFFINIFENDSVKVIIDKVDIISNKPQKLSYSKRYQGGREQFFW